MYGIVGSVDLIKNSKFIRIYSLQQCFRHADVLLFPVITMKSFPVGGLPGKGERQMSPQLRVVTLFLLLLLGQ
jgi:hypothetical protein